MRSSSSKIRLVNSTIRLSRTRVPSSKAEMGYVEEDEEDEEDEGILVLQSNGSKRVERWL